MTSEDLSRELRAHADKKLAVNLQRFFKTGKGEYAEGDIFLGLKVPTTRSICKKFVDLSQSELRKSLRSVFHEERLAALLILVAQAKMADDKMIKHFAIFILQTQSGLTIGIWLIFLLNMLLGKTSLRKTKIFCLNLLAQQIFGKGEFQLFPLFILLRETNLTLHFK